MVCSVWLHTAALLLLHLLLCIELSRGHLGNYEVSCSPSFFCQHFTTASIKCINKHMHSIKMLMFVMKMFVMDETCYIKGAV